MENSHIEWTDHTWNPWIGCTKVDELCAHCYAEARDIRFADGVHWGKGAPRQRTSEGNWREPYRWNRLHAEARAQNWERFQAENNAYDGASFKDSRAPRVFCASLADWLDDEVPIEWLADMLGVVHDNQNLTWLLLSKRPQNWKPRLALALNCVLTHGEATDLRFARAKWVEAWLNGTPPINVWMGTSVGNQKSADVRIPRLLEIPARIRFLSCEPLLGPVEFSNVTHRSDCVSALGKPALDGIHWVIAGGESGKGARPMHPSWARSLRDQCVAVGVKYFFKQWGEHAAEVRPGVEAVMADLASNQSAAWGDGSTNHVIFSRVGKRAAGRALDGRTWDEIPQ